MIMTYSKLILLILFSSGVRDKVVTEGEKGAFRSIGGC